MCLPTRKGSTGRSGVMPPLPSFVVSRRGRRSCPQVLGELFNVLVRKAGKSRAYARNALSSWRDAFPVIETSLDVMLMATDLAVDHNLGVWDAVILSAASRSGCRLLLSEDLQEGFTWAGVTVVNPFSSTPHSLLQTLSQNL